MQIGTIVKYAMIGCVLLAAGTMAYDMCKSPDTSHLCNGNWGIPRNNMPQIIGDVRDQFLKTLPTGSYFQHKINASILTPIQSEINGLKVAEMVDSYRAGTFNPCDQEIFLAVNSTHFNIIDGHHTGTACKLINGRQLATVVYDFSNQMLNKILNFPGVFRISL